MKILETELDFDFNDADDLEKLENATAVAKEKLNKINTDRQTTSKVIRKCCQAIFDCFNDIFGEGTDKKIFGDKTNLKVCLQAFTDLADARIQNDKDFESDINNIEKTYGINRAMRRAKK